MKGGSEKSEILCVGQLARAQKKVENGDSWGKYRPNISLNFILRKDPEPLNFIDKCKKEVLKDCLKLLLDK